LQRKGDNDPPDGGRTAWMVVLASWLVHFVVFGIMYSWGKWQSYYSTVLPSTSSEISLIGTVSFASIFLFGIPAGRLAECIGFRRTVLCGTMCLILGLVLGAFSTHHVQLVLTQGLLVGLGSSLIYFPSVSVPAQWWRDRRSFATGVAASGAGVGSVAFTALTDALLGGGLGHRSTLLALGVTSFSMLVLAVELMKTRIAKPPRRPFVEMMRWAVDLDVFRNRQFVPLMVAVFFNAFGSLIPFYFLPAFTTYLSLPISLGPLLLTIANIASTFGRILVGLLADTLGNLNSLLLTLFFQSAACFGLWLWLPTPAGLISFAALFGFMSGGYISLMPSVTAQVCGVAKLPSSIGLVFSGMMLGHLLGPPMAAGMV
ncbi:major facilitator superfamily domain-containing protein, partial [Catenaria anguillulae PL171]